MITDLSASGPTMASVAATALCAVSSSSASACDVRPGHRSQVGVVEPVAGVQHQRAGSGDRAQLVHEGADRRVTPFRLGVDARGGPGSLHTEGGERVGHRTRQHLCALLEDLRREPCDAHRAFGAVEVPHHECVGRLELLDAHGRRS